MPAYHDPMAGADWKRGCSLGPVGKENISCLTHYLAKPTREPVKSVDLNFMAKHVKIVVFFFL